MNKTLAAAFILSAAFAARPASAAVGVYGDKDILNTGGYGIDPTTGATLEGLAPGASTLGAPAVFHGFPFIPDPGEFPGTDQIFTGSAQTGFHDGYSSSGPTPGPQVITLDYASLVPSGQTVATLTLGIGADDFQFPSFGQPFVATINGVVNADVTAALNGLDQSGPVVQFFTVGIDPSLLVSSRILTLAIDQGGDGGDGWAVDFLTVGVTTVPEPSCLGLVAAGLALAAVRKRCSHN